MGVPSIGVEAHPLLHLVGKAKLYWEFDLPKLEAEVRAHVGNIANAIIHRASEIDLGGYPKLLHKCFRPEILQQLLFIRNQVSAITDENLREFLLVALLETLRKVSHVGTAKWQYILPRKSKSVQRDVLATYEKRLRLMLYDLRFAKATVKRDAPARLILGDARNLDSIANETVDFAFTSPPYLNNYDYADSTRLELYFLEWASTWKEITEKFRQKLIVSTTTQIRRSEWDEDRLLENIPVSVRDSIRDIVHELASVRLTRGGKKSYDFMVAGYFQDMAQVLNEVGRVLKPGSTFILVLGDSAPYGVYVPTLEYLGKIALGIGKYERYDIVKLRDRNVKWKNRKHQVPLMEGLLILQKN
jgi:SAM-dependent methyltransferase